MKKNVLLFMVLSAFILSGCKDGKSKLYIFNWSYYIPDTVLEGFEEEFNTKVVYDVFESNEEMFAKLRAGGTGYDITFPSGDYASIMINEGMVAKVNRDLVPNLKNIDENIIRKIKYDPIMDYSIPYMMGTAGVAVNTKFIKDFPKDFSIFEREDFKGRMTLLDDMREVIGSALASLGYSVNSVNESELRQAKEVVLKWKKNILKFDSASFGKGFASGEFWVVNGYAENVFLELDEDTIKDVLYFIPKNGGTMYLDSMVILKDSKNVELAHQFINYIHRPEVYAQIADYLMLPSINVEARKIVKEIPTYTIEDLANNEFKEDLGSNIELWDKIWQEIRVQN
ncbi:MAG: spermidine/putrescine ABC transporter substrate-binding protein [Spirochaetes bacterium GWF1_31_7]|nr:MAG: spermidine/putrescine ABC transporter substrate-binding protein [Spirochaetes bacterium GWE1_32_154]OHD48317.1 MAG: spermidine/putrescine ABC transporter substrate-binding protein [Spirochaetes bacterium GWE2_31_10]OHD49305.1 MAG: spermidine/putrescine ABC transporter substrate-binding protein [Spirochaetes bacterium GWF1_31_7]HBD92955.1 spermidine/putrescine ABC transporter substrate-binding protein [Spirochaetia bacterium]HBI37618.1 spermidine/putrescine ABC transporter substrate-bind